MFGATQASVDAANFYLIKCKNDNLPAKLLLVNCMCVCVEKRWHNYVLRIYKINTMNYPITVQFVHLECMLSISCFHTNCMIVQHTRI